MDAKPRDPETAPRKWARARKTHASKEPGNYAGAFGLLLMLLGVAGYLIERPPGVLDFGELWGWVLAAAGFALCLWGVVHEWRGPRRRSALLPGVAGIVFAWWLGWAAAEQTRLVYTPVSVSYEGDGTRFDGLLYLPRTERPTAGVVIAPGRDELSARSMRSLGRSLARSGVAALVYHRQGWGRPPRPVDARSRMALAEDVARAARFLAGRPRVDGERVGVLAFGEQGWALPLAAELDPAMSFAVLASTPVPWPDGLTPPRVPTLALYGTAEGGAEGLGVAYEASAVLEREGHPDSRVRVFIRAGELLQDPGDFGTWIQPRYASGMVDFVATWVSTRPPDPWAEVASTTP